jgi:hypothetical protein
MDDLSHGELRADIARLEERLAHVMHDQEQMAADLRNIRDTLANAKGGWRVLVAIATISSAVTGAIGTTFWWMK